ncbi:MAG: hypothetical protein IPH45_16635 [Bacteroidales bacterium]|nr:hypothetical protein [Bacteroidales bacterium]
MMAIDNVVVKQGITDDVGTAGVWAPTRLPVGQNYPWFSIIKNYGPNTETFDVDTKLRVNGTPTVTTPIPLPVWPLMQPLPLVVPITCLHMLPVAVSTY